MSLNVYDLMNAEYVTKDGKAVITLLARDSERHLHVFQIPDYPPHFWAKGDGPERDIFDRLVKKVVTNHPSDVRKERKNYEYHDEADILFPWRYLIDKGIYCGFTIQNGRIEPAESLGVMPFINLFDLEVETPPEILARPKVPKWPIVSFQFANTYTDDLELMMLDTKLDGQPIETPEYAKNCVGAITRPVHFELRQKEKVTHVEVHPNIFLYSDERLMIHDAIQRAAYFKFDGYSGYNSNLFDMPYWIRRANVLGVNVRPLSPFGVVECRERPDNTGKMRISPHVKGVQLFDLYEAYQKWSGGRQGAKLVIPGKDFAQTFDFHLVMERECGFYYKDLGDAVRESRQNHPVEWLEYCTGDAFALWLLEKQKGIIRHFNRLRALVGVPLEWSLHNSRLIDMRMLRLRSKPLPTKQQRKKQRVTGAIVFLPEPGIHENVAVIDAKSLYPTLIRIYNLSPETLSKTGEIKVGPMENGETLRFKKSPEGILPRAVRFDMEERDKYRAQLAKMSAKDQRYEGIKILETLHKFLAASYYGVTGYENFRLYSDAVRKAITFLGREALLECKRECEKAGYKVEYGDTDGLFIRLFGSHPNEGRVVEDIVNRTLRRIAWRHGAYYSLEAKYETFCRRIIFVPKLEKRHGVIVAAKKRYGYTDEKGNLYVIGLAPRRSSTPIIVRRNMLDWLFKVLKDNDVSGAIKLVRNLYETLPSFPLNVVGLPKGLHKAEYQTRNPWKLGVEFMQKRYGKVFREDKKPLLIYMRVQKPKRQEENSVFDKNTLSYAVCITETDTALPQELQSLIDWQKMREKVITANFKPLFQAIGVSWDAVIKGQTQEELGRWLVHEA
jgi:DNA polymerase I